MSMQRKSDVSNFTFTDSTDGVTADGQPLDVSQYAIAGIHATGDFDGVTLQIIDNGEWGNEVIIEKVLAAGFNYLTQTELLRFASAMQISCSIDSILTGVLYFKLKS